MQHLEHCQKYQLFTSSGVDLLVKIIATHGAHVLLKKSFYSSKPELSSQNNETEISVSVYELNLIRRFDDKSISSSSEYSYW